MCSFGPLYSFRMLLHVVFQLSLLGLLLAQVAGIILQGELLEGSDANNLRTTAPPPPIAMPSNRVPWGMHSGQIDSPIYGIVQPEGSQNQGTRQIDIISSQMQPVIQDGLRRLRGNNLGYRSAFIPWKTGGLGRQSTQKWAPLQSRHKSAFAPWKPSNSQQQLTTHESSDQSALAPRNPNDIQQQLPTQQSDGHSTFPPWKPGDLQQQVPPRQTGYWGGFMTSKADSLRMGLRPQQSHQQVRSRNIVSNT